MLIRTLTVLFTFVILFSSCGPEVKKEKGVKAHKSLAKTVDIKNSSRVKGSLYSRHSEWKGVRYSYGGLSKRGVDCSGFVYLTFKSAFGLRLPRTTKAQAKAGKEIKRSRLEAGDLVFFKTSRKVRHVGIYIEKGKFLHASTKRGVMISRLNDYYWKDKFWKARRVKR
jgi:cell wall-associated NlpC family hydrolase